jgi:ankyrin repeat protein
MHAAVRSGECGKLREYILNGVDIESRNIYGDTPLLTAVKHCSVVAVRQLLDAGAAVDASGWAGRTALHLAVAGCDRGRSADLIAILLGAGAAVNAQTADGWTALHFAARSGDLPAILQLCAAGANKDAATLTGERALHWAAYYGQRGAIDMLLELGADAGAVNDCGWRFPQFYERFMERRRRGGGSSSSGITDFFKI